MSGFFSSEAERALMGEEEEARRLFYSDPLNHPPPPGHPAYQGQPSVPVVPSQRWPPDYGTGPSNSHYWERSLSAAGPSSYATSSYSGAPTYATSGYPGSSTYATSSHSTTSYPSSLHPDDIDDTSSQVSRSSSPGNPSDLQNYGYPLADDGTQSPCFVATKDVELPPKAGFRVERIATGMKRSTNRTSLANGEAATECLVASTI
ncbi:MAG: hypothetical protein Q9181_000611 [Wetmoreana brouardii]